jgi:hypothetical protein
MKEFEFDREEALSLVPEFLELYKNRPISENVGGMGVNHSFAVWFMLKKMRPAVVIESGVLKGQSTWLIEQASPQAQVFCLDLSFEPLVYKSPQAIYLEQDFTTIDWSEIDRENTVVFFDDHINALARLKELFWVGIKHAIFEDNWPVGAGDSYSMRHLFAGTGATELQMSENYKSKNPIRRMKSRQKERILWEFESSQSRIVRPNDTDSKNLSRNLSSYFEFPPLLTNIDNNWGGPWTHSFQGAEPLFSDPSDLNFDESTKNYKRALDYGYICYVSLV